MNSISPDCNHLSIHPSIHPGIHLFFHSFLNAYQNVWPLLGAMNTKMNSTCGLLHKEVSMQETRQKGGGCNACESTKLGRYGALDAPGKLWFANCWGHKEDAKIFLHRIIKCLTVGNYLNTLWDNCLSKYCIVTQCSDGHLDVLTDNTDTIYCEQGKYML
jgi:hypothetical protein